LPSFIHARRGEMYFTHPLDMLRLKRLIKPDELSGLAAFGPVQRSSPQMAFRRKDGHMVPPTVPGDSEKVPASNSEKTILFADDDGQVQSFVAALLQRLGYKVILASGGNDALNKAHEFDGIIHLLLSDVEMPGMTGIELAIQLNQE